MSKTPTQSTSSPPSSLHLPQVRGWALEAGFAKAGLAALPYANQERDATRFEEWVQAGRAGSMDYLKRKESGAGGADVPFVRARVGIPFPWARSAIVCFALYNSREARSTDPAPPAPDGSRAMRGPAAKMRRARCSPATITRCS